MSNLFSPSVVRDLYGSGYAFKNITRDQLTASMPEIHMRAASRLFFASCFSERQLAWIKNRMGVRHAMDLNFSIDINQKMP